jgi:hypothetical protein
MEAGDGHFYVVKFANNPQSRRILANEWVASALLRHLEIAAPETAVIELSSEFLARNPEVCLQTGSSRREVEPGWHFGSRFPGNPMHLAVYDMLPDALLGKIVNAADFLGALAFDKWAGNSDARQAVFFRGRTGDWLHGRGENPLQVGFIAQMIDHGYIFDGPNWACRDAPGLGLFFRPHVYRHVRGIADFHPWLERIETMPAWVLDNALRELPGQWLPGEDRALLEDLCEKLWRRRSRVAELVAGAAHASSKPFPAWR